MLLLVAIFFSSSANFTAETGRHRKTSEREKRETQPRSQASGVCETQGDKRETRPGAGVTASGMRPQRSQRHSIWTGDKRETRPASQKTGDDTERQAGDTPNPRHSIWHPDTGRQAGDTTGASVTASGIRPQRRLWRQRLRDTERQAEDTNTERQAGDTTPEPSDRRDCETQGDKRKTRPRHLTAETGRNGETRPEPEPQHLASDRKREARPRSWRHSLDRRGDTGRQAGDTTPEPASQHLACDRSGASVTASGPETSGRQDPHHKKREMTQNNKRETPRSPRHSIWHPDTGRQAGDTRASVTASGIRPQRRLWRQRLRDTERQAGDTNTERQAGDTTPEPSDRRDCETQRDKRKTRPRTASQRLASDCRDWEKQGDKRETRPEPASQHLQHLTASGRSWRHSLDRRGDTGRQAGDMTLELASQHLASDRRDWETQGEKRETRPEPASQYLASDRRDDFGGTWEAQGYKRESRRRSISVTASGI